MVIVKVIELIGCSPTSWEDAAKHALDEAAKTIRNITGMDIVSQTADVKDNKIVEYKSCCKIAFLIEKE